MAIIDVVKFGGLKSRNWLVYKHYSEQLVWGTQLIVQTGQTAIFVYKGEICDVFSAGTYTLNTANLPILKEIINLPFGGNTPFSAEIYFINTVTKLDLTWGTMSPIQLIDPKYFVKLRVRAFGQMGLKITDPVKLFKELIGGMQLSDIINYDKVLKFYRANLILKVKSTIADTIIANKISALEISSQLDSLSKKIELKIVDEFEQYGLKVINFYIQSINFPDEDFANINKILEDKAAFEIIGEQRYVTKRSFDVYEGAAKNENGIAGAFVAGGMGMGAALNVSRDIGASQAAPAINNISENNKTCPFCNCKTTSSAKFCPECGFNFNNLICECGNKLEHNTKFCPECGKKVIKL